MEASSKHKGKHSNYKMMQKAKDRPTSTSEKHGGEGEHKLLWDGGLVGSWRKSPSDTTKKSGRRADTKTQREISKEPRWRTSLPVRYVKRECCLEDTTSLTKKSRFCFYTGMIVIYSDISIGTT